MVFPAGDDTPEVVKPRKEPLDFPAALHASQGPAILGASTATAVGSDHFNAEVLQELLVQRIGIVAAIANQSRRDVFDEAGFERGGDEVRLIR